MSRAARGRAAYQAGLAAEDIALRHYQANGAVLLARRWRGPEGEIDLVLRDQETFVFVEVKRRSGPIEDDPVSPAQWRRLEATAQRYILATETGERPCRFDLALVGADGAVLVIENARL